MENFSELIKNRRSMRKFTDEELSQEQVVTLLKAALMAPTSKRSNGWQFIAVDDKETLEKLSHCKEQASAFIADAALAIVVTADPLVSDVWIEDASIASIMLQLQAEDLGLGSCWVCNFDLDLLRTNFQLPAEKYPVAIIPLGYIAEQPERFSTRKERGEIVTVY